MALPEFRPCPCGFEHLERAERSMWMRVALPERRLYVCSQCRTVQFLSKRAVETEQAAARQRRPFTPWTPPPVPRADLG